MIHLVTYHTEDMSISADRCRRSALVNGVHKVRQWTRAALEQTEFFEQNKELLSQPRGDGFWSWKAFVISESLKGMQPGEILIYSDAGVEFIRPVSLIIDRMDQDVWLFGNQYAHSNWTKGSIMKALDCFTDGPQVQASVIFIRKTTKSVEFVDEWLKWCQVPELIDDSPSKFPNHPEFQENRHDQAILTTLAYKTGYRLHWWPAIYNNGAFSYPKTGFTDNYPPIIHHHRRRNHEYN